MGMPDDEIKNVWKTVRYTSRWRGYGQFLLTWEMAVAAAAAARVDRGHPCLWRARVDDGARQRPVQPQERRAGAGRGRAARRRRGGPGQGAAHAAPPEPQGGAGDAADGRAGAGRRRGPLQVDVRNTFACCIVEWCCVPCPPSDAGAGCRVGTSACSCGSSSASTSASTAPRAAAGSSLSASSTLPALRFSTSVLPFFFFFECGVGGSAAHRVLGVCARV